MESCEENVGSNAAGQVVCQVLRCGLDLTASGKTYCIKKRACTVHMQAEAVQLAPHDPSSYRFCQQCGKFEELSKFDGVKRSCRARLAKRRSGTRAQLLKRAPAQPRLGDASAQLAHEQAAATCSMPLPDLSDAGAGLLHEALALAAEQQKLMQLIQHEEQQLGMRGVTLQQQQRGGHGSPMPSGAAGCESSLSDGAAVSASVAATAAAATAAAAAAHYALSAPMPQLPQNHLMSLQQVRTHSDLQQAAPADSGPDDIMTQGELLAAMQADVCGGKAARTVSFAAMPAASNCSVPLAPLDMHSGHLPRLAGLGTAPGSPTASRMTADCKSAPLPTWPHAFDGAPSNDLRARHAYTLSGAGQLQHQRSSGSSSRLKWLIQQVQDELQTCCPTDLESLDNAELSTLLSAALAPGGCSSDAAVPAAAAAAEVARTLSSGHMLLQQQHQPPQHAHAELAEQVQQVEALQHQVEALQIQLAQAKHTQAASGGGSRAAAAAAAAAGGSVQRSKSAAALAAEVAEGWLGGGMVAGPPGALDSSHCPLEELLGRELQHSFTASAAGAQPALSHQPSAPAVQFMALQGRLQAAEAEIAALMQQRAGGSS